MNSVWCSSEKAVREARRDHEKIKEREKEESRMSLRELEDIGCDVELIVQLNELKNNLRIVMATVLGEECYHSQADQVSYSYLVCYTYNTV